MGRTLVISGTRKGIGRYLAEQYLAEGATVFGCSRDPSDLVHERYRHFCLDVANEEAVAAMMAEVRKAVGRLDWLINNAGAASMNHALLTPASTVERLFRTNAVGTFILSREAAKLMKRQRCGRIVNFTSVAAALRLEGEAAYAAAKAAVEMFTRTLAREFAPFGVTCNAVGPGPVATDLVKNVPAEKLKDLLQRQAIKRFAEMAEIKHVVDFFLSADSAAITGQVLYLGGVG